jgi:hypothetical protein
MVASLPSSETEGQSGCFLSFLRRYEILLDSLARIRSSAACNSDSFRRKLLRRAVAGCVDEPLLGVSTSRWHHWAMAETSTQAYDESVCWHRRPSRSLYLFTTGIAVSVVGSVFCCGVSVWKAGICGNRMPVNHGRSPRCHSAWHDRKDNPFSSSVFVCNTTHDMTEILFANL